MEEVNKSISDSIKSGQYFIDAKNWYFTKYVYPAVERTFFGFIVTFFVFSVAVLMVFTSISTSEVLESTYTITMDNSIKQIVKFQPLDNTIKPSRSLSKYMLSYYVETREMYDYNKIDEQLVKLSNVSTQDVYVQFHNYLSINNVNSPQFTYQKDNTRSVKVNKVVFLDDSHAQVYFTATVFWAISSQTQSSNWVADIRFGVSNLEQLLQSNNKVLDFVVTSYSAASV